MRVRLNLATKPLDTHRKFMVIAGAAWLIAGVTFLALGWHVYSVRSANAEVRDRTAQITREVADLQGRRRNVETFFDRPENAKLHDRGAFLNGIIDARSFDWTQMFMDLEHTLPAGVHVVSIEPKRQKGALVVSLVVGAASDKAKLDFLRAMENSKSFSHVQLLSEHVPNQVGSADQSVLVLTVEYTRV